MLLQRKCCVREGGSCFSMTLIRKLRNRQTQTEGTEVFDEGTRVTVIVRPELQIF